MPSALGAARISAHSMRSQCRKLDTGALLGQTGRGCLTPAVGTGGPDLDLASLGAVADPWAFPMLFPSLISATCRTCSSHSLSTLPQHCPHHNGTTCTPSPWHCHHHIILRAELLPCRPQQCWQRWGSKSRGTEQVAARQAKSQGPTHHTAHPGEPTLAQTWLTPGCTGGAVSNGPEHPQAGQPGSWWWAARHSSVPSPASPTDSESCSPASSRHQRGDFLVTLWMLCREQGQGTRETPTSGSTSSLHAGQGNSAGTSSAGTTWDVEQPCLGRELGKALFPLHGHMCRDA